MTRTMTYSVVAADGDAPVFRITAYDSDYGYHADDNLSAEQVFLFDSSRVPGYDSQASGEWQIADDDAYTRDLMPADIYQAAQALNLKYRLLECLVGYSFPIIPSSTKDKSAEAFGLDIPYEHPERVKNFPLNASGDGWHQPDLPDADITAVRNTIHLFCAFAERRAGTLPVGRSPLRLAGESIGLPCLEQLDYEGLFYCLAWSVIYVLDAARSHKEADPAFAGLVEGEGAHAMARLYMQCAERVSGFKIVLSDGHTTNAYGPWTYPRANQRRWNLGPYVTYHNNRGMWCGVKKGEMPDLDEIVRMGSTFRSYGSHLPSGAMLTTPTKPYYCNGHLRNILQPDGSIIPWCPICRR